jgi:hypothetical protein
VARAQAGVLAGELRFGAPDDHRRQLKQRVRKSSPLPKEARTRFLELLRRYFPVLSAGTGGDPEVPRLRRKVEELQKKALEEGPSKSVARGKAQQAASSPASALPLRALVHGEDLGQADRNVVILRRVIEYALAMEGMTLGLIQSLTMPGNETMAFKLPGFKETMRSFLHAIEQGKPVSVQRVEEYLDELKKWQVAILAAFHQAPGEWFDRLWRRINPVTIESAPRSAGWKLRGEGRSGGTSTRSPSGSCLPTWSTTRSSSAWLDYPKKSSRSSGRTSEEKTHDEDDVPLPPPDRRVRPPGRSTPGPHGLWRLGRHHLLPVRPGDQRWARARRRVIGPRKIPPDQEMGESGSDQTRFASGQTDPDRHLQDGRQSRLVHLKRVGPRLQGRRFLV